MSLGIKKNKALNEVDAIEEALQKMGSVSMDNEDDRATLAWWIHQTFCKGDFSKNLHIENTKPERKIRTVEQSGGGDVIRV